MAASDRSDSFAAAIKKARSLERALVSKKGVMLYRGPFLQRVTQYLLAHEREAIGMLHRLATDFIMEDILCRNRQMSIRTSRIFSA